MDRPKLSICIPTYNRSHYLKALLTRLPDDLKGISFSWEIVISDNASDDDTEAVVHEVMNAKKMPIKYIRQSTNIGSGKSLNCAFRHANGEFLAYLADDDILLPKGLEYSLKVFSERPEAVALYAPWSLIDLTNQVESRQFYYQPETVIVTKGSYGALAKHIIENSIFSEILIVRADTYSRMLPWYGQTSFWAFTHPCHYISQGEVIYSSRPFYGSVTRHHEDDNRIQAGNQQVMSYWDQYRGGLEHLLGLARRQLNAYEVTSLSKKIDNIVTERMLTGLRLRLHSGDNPIEDYYLAARLRGLGQVDNLPALMELIQSRAALHYVSSVLPNEIGADRLVLGEEFTQAFTGELSKVSSVPVVHINQSAEAKKTDIFLGKDDSSLAAMRKAHPVAQVTLSETDLFAMFP